MKFPRMTLRPARPVSFAPPEGTTARPRLILHAGSHKTGTTAIQFALSENRDHLEAAGVWYPPISDFFRVDPRLSSARAHFAFARAVADFTPRDQKRLARLVAAIHDHARVCDRTILSAESMFRLTATPEPGGAKETHLDRRKRFLGRLATVTAGFDTEILLYLRRVDRYAASLYAESIVNTDQVWSFEDFVKSRGQIFGYRGQIDRFKKHFPVRVRSFEAVAGPDLLRAFCEDAGIPGDLPETGARRRPSVPNAAVLWLCAAKEDNPRMTSVERTRRWHFALLAENAELFEADARTSFWRTRAQRDAFIEKHQAGVTEIAFPAPEDTVAPRVTWSAAQQAEAERRFRAWHAANRAMLRKRERNRIPPHVLDT